MTSLNDLDELGAELQEVFATHAMSVASLPEARHADLRESAEFSSHASELRCTCTITGSTYADPWDGTREEALAFAARVGEDTGWLVSHTPYYAWLRSRR
jgi:hypothetical protein